MILYVIALFLLNSYSRSLGAPADQPQNNASLTMTNLLSSLAKNCGNPFIATQIESSLPNCSPTAADHNRLFQCLIFYDINSQLCSAINSKKVITEDEFLTQVKKEVNVKDLCDSAKDWTFSRNYDIKVNLSTIFKDPMKCEKFCGVDDIFSTDTIFFCKYFDWGWKQLNSPMNSTSQINSTVNSGEMVKGNILASTGQVQSNTSVVSPAVTVKILSPISNQSEEQIQKDLEDIKVITQKSTLRVNSSTISLVGSNPSQGDIVQDNAVTSYDNNVNPATTNSKTISPQKPQKADSTSLKLGDETGDDNLEVNSNDVDADDEDNADEDDLAPNPVVNNKDIPSEELSHKEFYSPDITPEDDHFFPFFLTSIVLVVLIYILYHNKGKVTKVFLGLIVEGRQNGRRRNSRGHAYRRLDTLEQAMSGNMAAQPSKIIY